MADNTLYVIDLDRTLLDVDEVMKLAEAACARAGIDFAPVKAAQAAQEAKKQSYSPLDTIALNGEAKLNEFKQQFSELARPEQLLYADGQRFLAKLDELSQPYLILTYSVDQQWQKLKLAACGLADQFYVIISEKIKSKVIAAWRTEDGLYQPPFEALNAAEKIVMIDDRSRVFTQMPPNCYGFYLVRDQKTADNSFSEPNVEVISSFDQLIDKI